MSGLYVKDDGTWYLPKSIWVKSGTWRVCSNVYVKSGGAWKELIKTVDITSSKSNFNLYEYLGSPSEPLSVVVNISSSVEIFSSDTSGNRTPAFTVGNFPTNSTVIINNNGYISGGGGFGGTPEYRYGNGYYLPSNGTNGGDGLVKGSSNNFDCTIVNTGTIAGGGGGGAGGQIRYVCPPTPPNIYDDGCRNVNGNTGGQGAGITGASRTQGGSPMTFNPNPYDTNPPTPNTDTGGFGGALGEAGQGNGQTGSKARTGGAGGKAIGSGIEIAVSGTIIGAVG